MRCILPVLAVACLAFAPAPFPRPPKSAPATEVVVRVIGGIDRIELTFGTKKVLVQPDERWRENLVMCLKRFREASPAPRRLILRCDIEKLSLGDYISLRRICNKADYPELRREESPNR